MKHWELHSYSKWNSMIQRCQNENTDSYKTHGGRGSKVCSRWRNFFNFYADMGECPKGLTLDRINNEGNYEPGNCRWATVQEQANNRRSSRKLEYNGQTKTCAEWSREIGISQGTLHARLKAGWPVARALTEEKHNTGNQT